MPNAIKAVLDASALIAFLRGEPGADIVRETFGRAVISAVNYAEFLKKTIARGGEIAMAAELIQGLGVPVVIFDETQSLLAASLYPETKAQGMSFADRACLALGMHLRVPVLTAERKMALLSLPVKVHLIRNAS
jgi:PIN domain nuclease of toxin-antitoxin system